MVAEVVDVTHTDEQGPGVLRAGSGTDRRQTGREGEDLAVVYLLDQGWTVLERNWRPRGLPGLRGELDVVALEPAHDDEEPLLVVVEVKTRTSTAAGEPAQAVTAGKRRRLARLATAWAARHEVNHRGLRLDVVSVLLRGSQPAQLRHHRGVWS